jgi:hypothetical protein
MALTPQIEKMTTEFRPETRLTFRLRRGEMMTQKFETQRLPDLKNYLRFLTKDCWSGISFKENDSKNLRRIQFDNASSQSFCTPQSWRQMRCRVEK